MLFAISLVANAQTPTPELLYYKFNGTGTTITNNATTPPTGTSTAILMGGLSQGSVGLCGGAIIGSGNAASTDYVNTGWATSLSGSWTISFWSSNITPSTTLFYIFGDGNALGFRCFTNGVAGANNWILRGGFTDVLLSGGATVAPHVNTFVYDATLGNIKAYLDGVLVNTVAQASVTISGTGPFKVMGYNSNVGAPLGGLLDEFRVYNHALTAAEVLSLNSLNTTATITTSSCDSFISPSGKYTWTNSGTYTDTIANAAGCDSIITLNLTINPSPTATISTVGSTSFCSGGSLILNANTGSQLAYVWSQGSTADHITVTYGGTYQLWVTDINGCTATSTPFTVTENSPATSTTNLTSCSGVTWNGTTYTASGTYTYTITGGGSNGCDSVATLNLTINPVVVNLPTTSSFPAGSAMNDAFTASYGVAPYTLTTNSTLPTGVTFTNGTLSGTPTVTGTFPIVVSATDFAGCTGTSTTYNLVITCPSSGSGTIFYDGFESGSYTPTWNKGNALDSAKVTTNNPATGNYRLEGYGGNGVNHLLGLSTTIAAAIPTEVSWNIFPTTATGATNYVVIGDSNITGTNCVAFVYYVNGDIRFVNQSSILNFAATLNQWHHVALKNIDWSTKTFEIWIDNVMVNASYQFRGLAINYLSKIHLYNFNNGTGIWDDIRIGSQSVAPTGVATPASQTICSGGSITPVVLTGAPSGATYNWVRDNTSNLTGIAANDTGNISGSITNTSLTQQTTTITITPSYYGGCLGTPYTASVMVNPIVSSTTTIASCATYTWHNQTYTASGIYADTLIASSSTGCDSIAILDLTINPLPNVFAGNDTAICIGHSIALHGSGANNYTWDFFVNNGVAFNPNITRTYTVTGTDGNGCVNTDQIKVTVNSLPVVSAGMDTAVCSGQYAVLRGFGSNSTYTWNNGVTNLVPFIPSATQTYTVTGTDNNGCSSTDQVVVTVKPLPNVYGGNDTIICAGTNLSLVPSGAVTYTWTYSYGNVWSPIPGGTSTLNIAPNATVTYLLEGLGSNGCSNSDQVLITVRPLPTTSIDTIGSKSCFDANGNLFTLNGTSSAGTPTWSIVSNPNALNITWYTGQNVDSPVIKILGGTGGSVVFKYRVTSNQTPNCGVSEKSIAVKVIPIPTVNSIGNLSICNGTPVAAATFSSPQDSAANPVTFTWSNIAPPTGLNGQNIAGNLPGYTAINTSDILIYDAIKVTPTISLNGGNLVCQGTETLVRTVEVKPLPRAVLNNPNDTIQCNGSQLTLNIQPFVANQYTWTTSGDNVGLGSTIGNNPIPTFTATNIGNNTLTGNIVITPASVNGCSGVPLYFNVVVKPTPHLTNLPSKDSLCSGSTFTFTPTTNVSGTTVAWQRVGPNGINDTSSGINNIQETLSSHNALSYNAAQYNVHLNAAGCTNDTAIRVVVKPIPTKPTFTLPNDFCHNTSYINLQADRAPFANEHFIWSTEPDSALFQSQQRAMIKFALGQNIIHLQSEIIGSGCKTEAYTDTFNNTPTPFVDPYIIKKEYLVNDILHHIVLVCLHNPVQNYHWGRTNATTLVEDTQVYAAEKGQELYFKNPQDFDTANYYYWVKIVTDTENNCFRQIYYNGPFVSKSENVIVATNTPTSMKVYPNPAQTNVAVELTGKVEGNYQIKIQDVIGQVIQSFEMTDKKQQVDIQSLPSGYYLISCWQQGVHIATNKLIKN